jgi:hypothetical protein
MQIQRVLRMAVVIAVLPSISACPREQTSPDTTGSATDSPDSAVAGASCLPLSPKVRGSLVGQRGASQEDAAGVRVTTDSAVRQEGDARITIVPTCGSHTFREGDLARGQFVARLTISGTAPRFSPYADDVVLWWVYLDATSGRPEFRSEFLSTRSTSDSAEDYLRRGSFIIRCKPLADQPRRETARWEPAHGPEACPQSDRQLRFTQAVQAGADSIGGGAGDNPWYGCWLGCCQSAIAES